MKAPTRISFEKIGAHRVAVYRESLDKVILASECRCRVEWIELPRDDPRPGFRVTPNIDCPIDTHKVAALKGMQSD